jgi:DNA-3-methyladenine glycosylase
MYSIYGANYCFNVVAARDTDPEAVLIRAVEPIKGIDIIHRRRQVKSKKLKELTGGPAKPTKVMDIDMRHNVVDLRNKKSSLYIIKGEDRKFEIVRSKRINIDYAEEWIDKLWRFTIKRNPYVSI